MRAKGRTESRRWVRLVPARTTTPTRGEAIHLDEQLVAAVSPPSLPPPKPPCSRCSTASISSMKIRHGALARA